LSPTELSASLLNTLAPTDDELERARRWVLTQDVSASFPDAVQQVIGHVRDHR
jgi:hypothetical protein